MARFPVQTEKKWHHRLRTDSLLSGAERGHPPLDTRRYLGCRVLRKLEVVLEIPAKVPLVVLREAEREGDVGRLPGETLAVGARPNPWPRSEVLPVCSALG